MIDKQALFEAWAPPGEPWSGWAKPILFAHWPRDVAVPAVLPSPGVLWAPHASQGRALLVEAPGAESVALGLALMKVGYRPVPVFNAAPDPILLSRRYATPLVDVEAILAALVRGAEELKNLAVPSTAPPAYLIDQNRAGVPGRPRPGAFDNRSRLHVSDFPSAAKLHDQGVTGLVLVTASREKPGLDLDHLLRVWAGDGLALSTIRPYAPGPPTPLDLPPPSWLRGLWLRVTRPAWNRYRGYGHHASG